MLIRDRRKELGLTAREVAERMNVSRGLISQWEGGLTPIPDDRLPELADALEMTLGDLASAAFFVRTEADVHEWRDAVFRDHDLEPVVQVVLIWLPEVLDTPDGSIATYTGSIDRVATAIRSLSVDDVRDAWADVLASPYVERHTDAEWCLRLKFPPRRVERDADRA